MTKRQATLAVQRGGRSRFGARGRPPLVEINLPKKHHGTKVAVQAASATRAATWHYRKLVTPWAASAGMILAVSVARHAAHPAFAALLLTSALGVVAWRYTGTIREPQMRQATLAAWLAVALWVPYAVVATGRGPRVTGVLALAACGGLWWLRYRIRGGGAVAAAAWALTWELKVGKAGKALPKSRIMSERAVVTAGQRVGSELLVQLPSGDLATSDAIARTERITSAMSLPIGSVVIEPTAAGHADQAQVMVLTVNPLHSVHAWPGSDLDPATGISHLGLYVDGTLVPYVWWVAESGPWHDLIAGTTGSGKSSLINQLFATERAAGGLIVTWFIDPQHGQSAPDWVDNVDRFAGNLLQAMEMLARGERLLDDRSRRYARVRWTDAKGRKRRGRPHFTPTLADPLVTLTIDEAYEILAIPEARRIIEKLAKMGRKVGLKLRLLVQVPLLDQLGNSMTLRDQVAGGNVIVFRTANRLTGQVAFNGVLPVDPAAIPRLTPDGKSTGGIGYALGAANRPATMRSFYHMDPYESATTGETWHLTGADLAAAGPWSHKPDDEMTDEQEAMLADQENAGPAELPEGDAKLRVVTTLAQAAALYEQTRAGNPGMLPLDLIKAAQVPRTTLFRVLKGAEFRQDEGGRYLLTELGHTAAQSILDAMQSMFDDAGIPVPTDLPGAQEATGEGPRGTCPDCSVAVGGKHLVGCDWARCLATGGQRLSCDYVADPGHDCGEDVWTGEYPGSAECREFGWWVQDRCAEGMGFVPCAEGDDGAGPDLNRLAHDAVWDPAAKRWQRRTDRPNN